MNLLIITQTLDSRDPVLGFFHAWVSEFSKYCNKLTVIALEVGEYDLPENVSVLSLGKEVKKQRTIVYTLRLMRYAWKLRKDYDAVLAHMNPEYVLSGALLWKLLRKNIFMWYAHGTVSNKLKLATLFCKKVLTSTDNGYRLDNDKKCVIGQGIDVEHFKPADYQSKNGSQLKLVTVSRIAPVKHIETLIKAVQTLKEKEVDSSLFIIGSAKTEEEIHYQEELFDLVRELKLDKSVSFLGPVSQSSLDTFLRKADVFVSDGATGSLDKALLEAMATGLMVVSSNKSFVTMVNHLDLCTFHKNDSVELGEKIYSYYSLEDGQKVSLRNELRDIVVENHSLTTFGKKVMSEINFI